MVITLNLTPINLQEYTLVSPRTDSPAQSLVVKRGRILGIEVKAGATAKPEDFRGLRRLRSATAEAFACGIVLHDGDRI